MPLLVFILLSTTSLLWGDGGVRARYSGGTIAAIRANVEGKLHTTDEIVLEFRSRGHQHHVPYKDVNLLEYGQNVNRRLTLAVIVSPLLVLSKARKHYLTVGYTDREGKQQAMVFQVDKRSIRAVLVALEARTGLKVAYQDDEARRAGKG